MTGGEGCTTPVRSPVGQIGVVPTHYPFEVIMPDNVLRSMAGGGSIA
jgi:hypothetical protein